MPKYNVRVSASVTILVDAADEDAATTDAYDQVDEALDFGTNFQSVSLDILSSNLVGLG